MKPVVPPVTAPQGALPHADGGVTFRLWAPRPRRLALVLSNGTRFDLERDGFGLTCRHVPESAPGTRYWYEIEDGPRPDPASRYQPLGVHGPSEVVAVTPLAARTPGWRGPSLDGYVFYELHVGTFTAEGTFDGVIRELPRLRELGVTAIELMPVAQFPGRRNWGYDGAFPFAAQCTYGGPRGLVRLVDACHALGLAVVLDVVCNHLGPEGSCWGAFAPCTTGRYHTPWGAALNFDDAGSDLVRAFFIQSALYWLRDIGMDALRLDAIHGIFDASAQPFLAALSGSVAAEAARSGRNLYLIAESDLNDVRALRARAIGGFGLDAQWSDDFHHGVHALLTGERAGYYADFGAVGDLARAVREHFVYAGQYSIYRRRSHGNSAAGIASRHFVCCVQNHDQVGNRPRGDRLSTLVDFERRKLAAGVLLLSPALPLLFMGEEYGETAPFPYFIDHGDPELVAAVRRGRAAAFAELDGIQIPDPADEATFVAARLQPGLRWLPRHEALERLYRALLRLRGVPAPEPAVWHTETPPVLLLHDNRRTCVFHFGFEPARLRLPWPAGAWRRVLDSAAEEWLGPGTTLPAMIESRAELVLAPASFAVCVRAE